ncbi:uncharacterized protein FOMMEDRAFT_165256 [Fomitiporia mediterranea MF3/22]|uniref:uncharacterized protein n=1 Tax=Fomitiporia mediterranea (strain MF3/22) TaxID=694068 RepID=UPI0004409323|nr:uncharacterized protein FOMMEDRAFT_165256 [Fomitiporia mediterranea MF3/22]EJD06463.1 hypothetical protein FOMMEDRAFT_165256 [Fomitiporia mediterranea MF3/22]
MIASTLFALALVSAVRAQTSTASLLPIGFEGDGLQGEVVGTGTDGTTYVLSGTFDTFSIPFTMTLVEDASHISETANIASELLINAECTLSGNNQAVCAETIVVPGSSTTAMSLTGSIELTPIALASNTGGANGSTRSQVTITGTGTTPPSATGASTLPASIPIGSGIGSSSSSNGIPSPSNTSGASSTRRTTFAFSLGLVAFWFFGALIEMWA